MLLAFKRQRADAHVPTFTITCTHTQTQWKHHDPPPAITTSKNPAAVLKCVDCHMKVAAAGMHAHRFAQFNSKITI